MISKVCFISSHFEISVNSFGRRGAVVGHQTYFDQICKSTSEWNGLESRWFCLSGLQFAKTPMLIKMNAEHEFRNEIFIQRKLTSEMRSN